MQHNASLTRAGLGPPSGLVTRLGPKAKAQKEIDP
jgi:hypothetical protein